MAIFNVQASALTRSTVASATYTAKLSQAVSVVSGVTYAIFWYCILDVSASEAGSFSRSRLQNTTDATTLAENSDQIITPTTELQPRGGVALFTAAATTSKTFEIQFSRSAGTITVGCQQAKIIVFELESGIDFWASSTGISARSTGTYSSKISLAVAPASTKDMLIAFAYNSNAELQSKVNDGTSDIYLHDKHDYWNSGGYVANLWFTRKSIASSTTFDLLAASATGTSNIREAYIVAMDMSKFANNLYGELLASANSTSTTYASRATVTGTVATGDHLILGSQIQSGATAGELSKHQLRSGGAVVGIENLQRTDGGTYKYSWFSMHVENIGSGGSRTFDTQWARATGTGTHSILSSVVAAIELAPPPAAGGGTKGRLLLLGVG